MDRIVVACGVLTVIAYAASCGGTVEVSDRDGDASSGVGTAPGSSTATATGTGTGSGATTGSGAGTGSGSGMGTGGSTGTDTLGLYQTCEEVHGSVGCCEGGDENWYSTIGISRVDCEPGDCGWDPVNEQYRCGFGGAESGDPNFPIDCGLPFTDPYDECTGTGTGGPTGTGTAPSP